MQPTITVALTPIAYMVVCHRSTNTKFAYTAQKKLHINVGKCRFWVMLSLKSLATESSFIRRLTTTAEKYSAEIFG